MKRRSKEKHLSGEQPDSESSTGREEEEVKGEEESADPKSHRETGTGSVTGEHEEGIQDPAEDKPSSVRALAGTSGSAGPPESWRTSSSEEESDRSVTLFSRIWGRRRVPLRGISDSSVYSGLAPPAVYSPEQPSPPVSTSTSDSQHKDVDPSGLGYRASGGYFIFPIFPPVADPPLSESTDEERKTKAGSGPGPETEMTGTPAQAEAGTLQGAGPVLFGGSLSREDSYESAFEPIYEQMCSAVCDWEEFELIQPLKVSVTNTQPMDSDLPVPPSDPGHSGRVLSSSSRPHSAPPPAQTATWESLKRAASLPAMMLESSFEEFTPDITEDGTDESYRFRCSCPGLYRCSVTGLVFDMEGEGDVVYGLVPWNRSLLGQHHKKPAGPLFDIRCQQQSVSQLHLPHCEVHSTGGRHFLSVAHVKDEGVDFISPEKVTETHVVINITGFSGFGNVKDEDSPPDPIRALVLLFYRPPDDPDVRSFLSILLLPRNVVIRDVVRTRRERQKNERYIDASSRCQLHPQRVYSLSTDPEDDSVKVQPTEEEFDAEFDSNYVTSFQVILKKLIRDINLSLKDQKSSRCVWEREVCLLPARVKTATLPATKTLFRIRSGFVDGASGPVLKTLLDKLLEKEVITDSERESAEAEPNKGDRARTVIDWVRKKGEAASSAMIKCLCEVDPFLCKHLELI